MHPETNSKKVFCRGIATPYPDSETLPLEPPPLADWWDLVDSTPVPSEPRPRRECRQMSRVPKSPVERYPDISTGPREPGTGENW